MREPIVLLALCACLLGACASPRAVGKGDLTSVAGASAVPYGGQVGGADALYAQAVQEGVLDRLRASPGDGAPLFLVQVVVARPLPRVGASSAADALDPEAWRSAPQVAPWWRFWARPGNDRAVTMAVIDARNGKTVAWSSIRVRHESPATVADRLIDAVGGASPR